MDKARLGTVYLSVPKIRQGGYIPFFVTEKKRSEQALIQVVQECWLNGVSTRKIESIAKRQYADPPWNQLAEVQGSFHAEYT